MGQHLQSYIFLDLDLPNITLVRAILIFKFHVPRAIIFSIITKNTHTDVYTDSDNTLYCCVLQKLLCIWQLIIVPVYQRQLSITRVCLSLRAL